MNAPKNTFCGNMQRREFITKVGGGFTHLALAGLLAKEGFAPLSASAAPGNYRSPLESKPAHFPAKAKNVIFLFMYGGPSHIDTFDRKPKMKGMNDKTVDVKTFGRGGPPSKASTRHATPARRPPASCASTYAAPSSPCSSRSTSCR